MGLCTPTRPAKPCPACARERACSYERGHACAPAPLIYCTRAHADVRATADETSLTFEGPILSGDVCIVCIRAKAFETFAFILTFFRSCSSFSRSSFSASAAVGVSFPEEGVLGVSGLDDTEPSLPTSDFITLPRSLNLTDDRFVGVAPISIDRRIGLEPVSVGGCIMGDGACQSMGCEGGGARERAA